MNDRKYRVLYITHDANLSGSSQSLLDLIDCLDKERVDATVLLRGDGPLVDALEKRDIPYDIVPYITNKKSDRETRPDFIKRVMNRLYQPGVTAYVKRQMPDIIHCNNMLTDVGMIAARRLNIPFVIHVREAVVKEHGVVFLNEKRTCSQLAHASHIIYISEFLKERFSKWGGETPSSVIYDSVKIGGGVVNRSELFAKDAVNLALFGRYSEGKGQLEAIQATELLLERGFDVTLTLAGGDLEKKYGSQCAEYVKESGLQDRIQLNGFRSDLDSIRANTDILLMCSRNEGMGRTTIEGMLSGCLVVGANNGATLELIDHENTGLLYQTGDVESLANTIEWAVRNPVQSTEIAAKGRIWANDMFTPELYKSKIMQVYDSVTRCS